MNPQRFFMGRAIGFVVILALAGIVAAFFAFNNYIYQEKQGDGTVPAPYRATLSGEYVCLPHVDTSDPQTTECAFGLKTDAGEYYAIDLNLMSQTAPELKTGDWISGSGTITPIAYLSSDHWRQYPIEGIFSVTDSLEIIR